MGRVTGDEHPSVAVAVGDAVADPEHRGPPQCGGGHRSGRQPFQGGFDVLGPRGLGVLRTVRGLVRRGRLGPLVRVRSGVEQRRDPVARTAGQRNADEQVVDGAVLGAVQSAHHVTGGQVPVQLDVGQQVRLGERPALERQPQPFADEAVGAVAADEELAAQLGLLARSGAQPARHPGRVLCEGHQFRSAFDVRVVAGEVLLQDALGLVLRQCGEAVRHLGRQCQLDAGLLGSVDVDELSAQGYGGVQHVAHHARPVPELQGPRLYAHRPGVGQASRQAVHEPAPHARLPAHGPRVRPLPVKVPSFARAAGSVPLHGRSRPGAPPAGPGPRGGAPRPLQNLGTGAWLSTRRAASSGVATEGGEPSSGRRAVSFMHATETTPTSAAIMV